MHQKSFTGIVLLQVTENSACISISLSAAKTFMLLLGSNIWCLLKHFSRESSSLLK